MTTPLRIVAVLALASCGSSSGSSPDAPAADAAGSDADGTTGDLLGTFSVQLVAPRTEDDGTITPGYTALLGKVYDGLQPDTVIWTPQLTDTHCTLSTPTVPFCETACGSSAACTADDTCTAYPTSQSVGTVHVTGVASTAGTEFDLTAIQNSYQPPGSVTLSYPAFAEGDAITAAASGSDFTGAFTLRSVGVAQLALANADSIALAEDQPLDLAWTPPGAAGATSVHVKLDISHHGGSKGKIECDTDDTGALTISAAMVDELLDLGAAGYPTIIVTRSATGHAAAATGHVDLVISSEVEAPISVPGVQSCTDDTQCTPPQTCQSDLTCG